MLPGAYPEHLAPSYPCLGPWLSHAPTSPVHPSLICFLLCATAAHPVFSKYCQCPLAWESLYHDPATSVTTFLAISSPIPCPSVCILAHLPIWVAWSHTLGLRQVKRVLDQNGGETRKGPCKVLKVKYEKRGEGVKDELIRLEFQWWGTSFVVFYMELSMDLIETGCEVGSGWY
ncbi:hypothetical protein BDN67DRAFT_984461 [Paxillus ammoniavirescens]|nr:hypothetical protein BDN67DRAFT_984461 [Paxillus ammoniavirescens]